MLVPTSAQRQIPKNPFTYPKLFVIHYHLVERRSVIRSEDMSAKSYLDIEEIYVIILIKTIEAMRLDFMTSRNCLSILRAS